MCCSSLVVVAALAAPLFANVTGHGFVSDRARPLSAIQDDTIDKRFLRIHKIAVREEDDDEERVIDLTVRENMMSNAYFRNNVFQKWASKLELSDRKALEVFEEGGFQDKYRRIFTEYQKYIEQVAPHLVSK